MSLYVLYLWFNTLLVPAATAAASSGGSRISRRGRGPVRGAWHPKHGCFLVKMCAKMKELGPIEGHAPGMLHLHPPMASVGY